MQQVHGRLLDQQLFRGHAGMRHQGMPLRAQLIGNTPALQNLVLI